LSPIQESGTGDVQAYLDNIDRKTGKTPDDFCALAEKGSSGRQSGNQNKMTKAALSLSATVDRPAPRPWLFMASRVAAAGPVAVALIIVALHAIKPEFQPSWRFISEYAIGPHGWIMKLAFLIWAASCAALALTLKHELKSWPGKIGVAVLLIVAVALVPAGLFAQDPVTAKPHELTTSGNIHAIASMIGIPGIPIAAMLISSSLWRTNQAWTPYRRSIMWAAHAAWISLVLMGLYLAWAVPRAGGFNADVWAGWMNRLVVATYIAWQFTIAYRLITISKAQDRTSDLRFRKTACK
jgi:hypothetical protein